MDDLHFTWDPRKAEANLRKHGVSFDEGSTLFRNPLAAVLPDPAHSGPEVRLLIIGRSAAKRLLLVVFTERFDEIRIISAREHRVVNDANMKNSPSQPNRAAEPEMPAEYKLDWSKARKNPYAARLKDTIAVVLAPDVAEVFPTSESVNAFLRSVIAAVPRPRQRVPVRMKAQHPRKAG